MEATNFWRAVKDSKRMTNPMYQNIIPLADKGMKFTMPHNGVLFDFKARQQCILKLPFPVVVLEFTTDEKWAYKLTADDGNKIHVVPDKRVVIATQGDDDLIKIYCVYHTTYDKDGHPPGWLAMPCFGQIKGGVVDLSDDENLVCDVGFSDGFDIDKPENSWIVEFSKVVVFPASLAVLGLIEALECNNINTEALPIRKQNKSAKKRGALPFDQYHVLTVTGVSRESGEGTGGSGRSPREHMRRGHVRTYKTGLKTWVQATVVNAGAGGVIHKDYILK